MPCLAYKVVQEQTSVAFEAAMQVALEEGWEPYGSLATQVWEYDSEGGRVVEWWYIQAMTRYGPGPAPMPA